MISQYDLQKLTDLILENRDALNNLHTATTEQKMQAAYEFANTDRELFNFVELLAARDEQPTTAEADGWVEWRGGDCPVDEDRIVDIRFHNGTHSYHTTAGAWDWVGSELPGAITAFRIVQ